MSFINEKKIINNKIEDKNYVYVAKIANELYKYGDIINKDWLLSNFELKMPENGTFKEYQNFTLNFMEYVESIKSIMLEEYSKHLVSIKGEGYLIIMPSQQTEYAMKKLQKTIRTELNRAVTTIINTNEELLSLEDIKRKSESLGNIAALQAFTKKQNKFLQS